MKTNLGFIFLNNFICSHKIYMLECDWILKSLKISLIRQLYDCLYEQPKQVYRNRNYTDVCKKEE